MAADEPDAETPPPDGPLGPPADGPLGGFLTPRRAAGLLGAAVLATAGYWLVTRISTLNAVIFFAIFLAVFGVLNYAVWRYD